MKGTQKLNKYILYQRHVTLKGYQQRLSLSKSWRGLRKKVFRELYTYQLNLTPITAGVVYRKIWGKYINNAHIPI